MSVRQQPITGPRPPPTPLSSGDGDGGGGGSLSGTLEVRGEPRAMLYFIEFWLVIRPMTAMLQSLGNQLLTVPINPSFVF